ncbi:hypothetical protein, partial [Phaeovulum sp.]|uniref:hypothetical protein n=1 Tax=Phaeovulum sp. TaxID=2934796 RepID=UPI0027311516
PVCPKAGAPPRMRLRNRKIDAICPKKVSQRRSDGHLGEAEAVNQTFLEACAYVVGRLVFEVIRINRQRLDFAKLSIIAKDVSAASAHSTGLSASEVFDAETKLKMELLREHMKNYTGSEFEYKGSAIISAIVGVAERLSGGKHA